jgi:hypothetical protein
MQFSESNRDYSGVLWYGHERRDAALRRRIPEHFIFTRLRIPAMPITNSNLMAIRIPIDADHHRSEATLGCTYHR